MIDHVVLNVKEIGTSRKFYEAALAPLGYKVVMAYPEFVGFGEGGKPDFWIAKREPTHTRVHVALHCRDRNSVDAFHAAALAAGAKDNGAPGIRTLYHPNYYGAFVFDLDGNNIEAVCHAPQG